MDPASYSFDLQRIFVGDLPPLFLLEIVFRTLVLYLYTLLLLRLLGKRGIQQLTFFEFAIIIALGSAVGDPMFYDDVPLLYGAVVVTVIVSVQRLIARITERDETIETILESAPKRLVRDGVLEPDALREERVSKDEIFSRFRKAGLRHLGQIERAYLEPSGDVSIWEAAPDRVRPGLTLMPTDDPDYPTRFDNGSPAPGAGAYACTQCGDVREFRDGEPLVSCACRDAEKWLVADTATASGDEREHGRS